VREASAAADDETYRRVRRRFGVAYMSNTKWRRLFTVIARSDVVVREAVWAFIDSGRSFRWGLPGERDLLQTRLRDGAFLPFEYRWIRSIHIPRKVGLLAEVEIARLASLLREAGDFMLEESEAGLTILGYGAPEDGLTS